MNHANKVYLVVHELFGVSIGKNGLTLVTPKVEHNKHQHKYLVGRFADGAWGRFTPMSEHATYELRGVLPGGKPTFPDPCSPCPAGDFGLGGAPFCTWKLKFPRKVHRLRLVDIDTAKPLFSGTHGEGVNESLRAVSIVQAYEYLPNGDEVQVVWTNKEGKEQVLPFKVDPVSHTVNIHIWAEIDDGHFTDPAHAVQHAIHAFDALRSLFNGLEMTALNAVPTDDLFGTQPPTPEGIRFVELMTLSEIFNTQHYSLTNDKRPKDEPEHDGIIPAWTPRTCGVAGNLYVRSSSE